MLLTRLLVNKGTVVADLHGLAAMALVGRHELDAAVAVSVVVPIHKRSHPLAGLAFAGEWPVGGIGPVFGRFEQGFRVRIVVGDPGPGDGSEDAQLLHP